VISGARSNRLLQGNTGLAAIDTLKPLNLIAEARGHYGTVADLLTLHQSHVRHLANRP